VSRTSESGLERKVAAAAAEALARHRFVTPIDICVGLGWVHDRNVAAWRQGRIGCLEDIVQAGPVKLTAAFDCLARWASANGLEAGEAEYAAAGPGGGQLRCTADGDPAAERAWRAHWVPAGLPAAERERLAQRADKPADLLVIRPVQDWACAECGGTGDLLTMGGAGPLCLPCADLDHLVLLPSGDAALTRRARKASSLSAVVVRWSRARRRYERQGVLVKEAALAQAEQQCLADEDARLRRRERDRERRAGQDLVLQARFAAEIARLYPGCPAGRAAAIARHAGVRGSGRVGRSAPGRALDEQAITRAVVASVRHEDTGYDALPMSGVPRDAARDRIRPAIDRILATWSAPAPEPTA
jgi:hypothetical protein